MTWNHPNATRKGFWRLSMCPRHAKLHAGKYCLMELLEYRGEADKIKPASSGYFSDLVKRGGPDTTRALDSCQVLRSPLKA